MVNSSRAPHLFFVMLAGFIALFLNLIRLQIFQGDFYQNLSEKNRIRVVFLEAPRGKIIGKEGSVLASSRLSFNCSAIAREAKTAIHESCMVLANILNQNAMDLENRFIKKRPGAYNTILMAQDIPQSQAMAIEEKSDALPGFIIETRPKREYPLGVAAGHITGFIGPMTEEEADRLEPYGYRPEDWLGQDGLEKSYESYLRGVSGGLQMEVDSRGRLIKALGVKEPKEGKDLQLTVDGKLQCFVQKLLESQKGCVIVMELNEGGILSMNSSPSFNPNDFSSKRSRQVVGPYLHNPDAPMVNRAIRGRYPPGSIFKIVTALAALERHKINASTAFHCSGFSLIGGNHFNCWSSSGHGPQTLVQAFQHSCNVFFYNTGVLVGADALYVKSLELGFSKVTGIDLPGEKEGFVPSRSWKKKARHESWYEGETANLAIGQGYLQVTPAQALVMIAAVATNGKIIKPHLVDKIGDVKVAEKYFKFSDQDTAYWPLIKQGLDLVINSDTGTGRLARLSDLHIAGKTGTAQSGQDKTHAWFVGFAPLENPKIAMVVFLENGGRGGVVAARLAGSIFKWLKETGYFVV